MKTIRQTLILLTFALFFAANVTAAPLDERQRTVETVVADPILKSIISHKVVETVLTDPVLKPVSPNKVLKSVIPNPPTTLAHSLNALAD